MPIQPRRQQQADANHREAVSRVAEARRDRHREVEGSRYRHGMKVVADQQCTRLLEQQDQGERQQHLVEMLAPIELPEQHTLEDKPERHASDDADRQRQP